MELLYLWIKEYKGLKKVGLNLSNKYRFQYDEKQNVLEAKFAENYVPDFFGENISNFTGIIGENGAGKTSILRYIMEYCSGGIHNSKDEQALIIVRIKRKIRYYSFLNLTFKLSEGFPTLARIEDLEDIKSAATTIFLSNTFDPTSFHAIDYSRQQFGDTKNLSTWHLLHFDYQNKLGEDAFDRDLTFNEKIETFSSQELIRMVRLFRWLNRKESESLENNNKNRFPVKPPPYLNLALYFNKDQENDKKLRSLKIAVDSHFEKNRSKKDHFLINAFLAAIFHLVGEEKFVNGSEIIKNEYLILPGKISDFIKNNDTYENTSNHSIVEEFQKILNLIFSKEINLLNNRIDEMLMFLEQLRIFISKRDIIINKSENTLSVKLIKANKSALEELIEEYYKVERVSGFADFYFSHKPARESSLSVC